VYHNIYLPEAEMNSYAAYSAIRKIAYKQILWRIYRKTGNIEDYNNYKKALELATAEMRKKLFRAKICE